MTEEARSSIRDLLQRRCVLIADHWYMAIARTSFTPFEEADIRGQLLTLTSDAIDFLLAASGENHAAQAIGAALISSHFIHHKALGNTVEVLGQLLLAGLPADQVVALQPRLAVLLGGITAGYFRQARATILAEQEQIRGALLAERTEALAALRLSEARLRMIVTNLPIILFVTDRAGVITLVEGKGLHTLNLMPNLVVGKTILDAVQALPTADVSRIRGHFKRALAGETFTVNGALRDLVYETRYGPLRDQQNCITGVIGIAIDVTERVRMEQELALAHQRLAERQETEILHVAHDLHDSIVQELMAIKYHLEALQQQAAEDPLVVVHTPSTITAGLEAARQQVLGVVTRLREVIGDLRPAGLEDLGLSAALEGYVAHLLDTRRSQLPAIDLDIIPVDTTLPSAVSRCVFRVAQEALRNAIQHAQAEHITIRLRRRGNLLVLSVRDDGVGFVVPDQLSDFLRANHFGLIGIAERVRWVGGHLELDSQPGAGTDLTVRVPVK